MKKCPSCGSECEDNIRFCGKCNRSLEMEFGVSQRSAESSMTKSEKFDSAISEPEQPNLPKQPGLLSDVTEQLFLSIKRQGEAWKIA